MEEGVWTSFYLSKLSDGRTRTTYALGRCKKPGTYDQIDDQS